ncbi:hypothetical protein OZY43_07265 [Lactobacillus sp. ESL0785]|uniref:hypothetical protein n=1 Tax=Lactobacillus sp. ESL0785 TaxID=2983232 RepID=UPI0023F7B6FD|nr:hypothetical protein [Lactobacillus sp. ESL0785]WEV70727.1 hypothetical protein OZY43_07265 [Lactobacillus sp. ESL0785]
MRTDFDAQDPSEDFSYYALKSRVRLYIGCDIAAGRFVLNHSLNFMLDEACLIVAAKATRMATVHYLTD